MNAHMKPIGKLPLDVLLARPRGFCAGVVRAIDIVERALKAYGAPVYVRHEIVHNRHVVERLRKQGAVFVDDVDQIPEGAVTVFSAHGVAKQVEADAAGRALDVIDATCPLVTKVHKQGRRYAERGYDVILIGHENHPEVVGTLGQVGPFAAGGRIQVVGAPEEVGAIEVRDPERVAYVTQTTLSVQDTRDVIAALTLRFPAIVGPDVTDICYATQNRQTAVAELAARTELVLVIGSANSSNSNRLREIAELSGARAHLIDDASRIDPAWLDGVARLGLSAGASAPEDLVQEVIAWLSERRAVTVVDLDGVEETIEFRLPRRLEDEGRRAAPAGVVLG